MKNVNIIAPPKNKIGCKICNHTGLVLAQSVNRDKSLYLSLCQCVLSNCASCEGDQVAPYFYFDEASQVMKPCLCANTRNRLHQIESLFAAANVPLKYRYRSLDAFVTASDDPEIYKSLMMAHDSARHFLSQFETDFRGDKKGLFFFGAPGSGKTMLSSLILNELIIKYQVPVKFIKITRDFFNVIRSTFNKSSDFYGQTDIIFNRIAEYEVLVIDDLGVQLDSLWEQTTLYDLIDSRYDNQRVTIINSNFEPEEFRNIFEGRLFSRLKEMLDFHPIINTDFRDNFVE